MSLIGSDFPFDYGTRRWHGRWIGPARDTALGSRVLFRRSFEVSQRSLDAGALKLAISAEREYHLSLNGSFVARGVPPSPYYYKFFDEVDVAEHLRPGANCIAVLVSRIGAPQAGLFAELGDDNGRLLLTTDSSWRVSTATGWEVEDTASGIRNDAFHEYFDARIHPWGWERPDYDDTDWDAPHVYPPMDVVGCPWTRMVKREAPTLAEWEVPPASVAYTEEGLDLMTRHRGESLSVLLSAAGKPVEYATVENAEALCATAPSDPAAATTLRCSTAHHYDPTFDGIYAPSVVIEFDRVITGYLTMEVDGVAGAHLDVGYSERLVNGHFNNAIEVNYADRYILGDGRQTLSSTNWKGFRYVKIRLTGTEHPVSIRALSCVVSTAGYRERGVFSSSDETLNAVFDISRHTMRLCSRDFVMDTPWRERNQWLGDTSLVILPGIYRCFGDTGLARQFLKAAAATVLPGGLLTHTSQGYNVVGSFARKRVSDVIADYSLLWIMALWRHYLFTAEADLIPALYPRVLEILQFHWRHMDDRGIVSHIPAHQFVDHVYKPGTDPTPAYNAIWYRGLASALELARFMGDDTTERAVEQTRAALCDHFTPCFFDAEIGCFRDGTSDAGPAPPTPLGGVSEQANMAAVAWGLASAEQSEEIIDHLFVSKDVPYRESAPYFASVTLKAFRASGRREAALDYIRERWGRRMVGRGMTSTTEEWTASGSWRGHNARERGQAGHEAAATIEGAWHGPASPYVGIFRSLSHAWSAAPAEYLIPGVAGFRVLEPGCGRVAIDPLHSRFDYSVSVPTPRGEIRIAWQSGRLDVTSPNGVDVTQ